MTHRTVQDAGPTATATPNRPLLDRLHSGTPLLGDGATGTMLHLRADLPSDACFEALVLTAPDVVLGLHRDYVAAGVDVLSTNTFAANAVQLRQDHVASLHRKLGLPNVTDDAQPDGTLVFQLRGGRAARIRSHCTRSRWR